MNEEQNINTVMSLNKLERQKECYLLKISVKLSQYFSLLRRDDISNATENCIKNMNYIDNILSISILHMMVAYQTIYMYLLNIVIH